MLLVITNLTDFATDYLLVYLRERSRRFIRLNAETAGTSGFEVGVPSGASIIEIDGQSVDMATIHSVLYRRSFTCPGHQIGNGTDDFQRREHLHTLQGALLSLNATWVNPMGATAAAERKLRQLRIAAECGLSIPRTIITTNPTAALSFANQCPSVIVKPISYGLVMLPDGPAAAYAARLRLTPETAEAVRLTPTLLQEEVVRGTDYRVTVIGQRVFPIRVSFHSSEHVDWRYPGAEPQYQIGALPTKVRKAILRVMRRLSLRYGAFDLIHSASGEWYFLEVNAAGEWAWLEEATGAPMRAAFEELLYE